MIKVGQIYFIPYLGGKTVVSWIRNDKTEFALIRDDGFTFTGSEKDYDWELIAEYPTWQEAVNSKEFKGEDK